MVNVLALLLATAAPDLRCVLLWPGDWEAMGSRAKGGVRAGRGTRSPVGRKPNMRGAHRRPYAPPSALFQHARPT